MRAAEILRKLADVIDAQEGGPEQPGPTEITNRPEIVDVEVAAPTDTADIEGSAGVNTQAMISPLQLQAELLKQVVGTSVGGCTECGSTPCACAEEPDQPDELAIIRQNAGI
jgi:hypothetical protein